MKRNLFIFVVAMLLSVASAFAQTTDVLWKKNFGGSDRDLYYSVIAVSDGIVAVGYSSSASFGNGDWAGVTEKGSHDAIIVKHDNAGNVVWKKNFGGNNDDYYQSVTAVSDGVVAVGYSTTGSFGNGDWKGVTGKGNWDAIIVKYDNAGNVVWKKNFGGSGYDEYFSVTAVSDGVVAVGLSDSFGNGDWTGVTEKGGIDAIIIKYDNAGNVVWKKRFGGSDWDYFYSVTAVSDGVVAVGYSGISTSGGNGDWEGVTGKGNDDAIIVKYDNAGNVIWKKNFGGSDRDLYYSVIAVSDGIVAVGYSSSASFGNGDWEGVTGKGNDDAIIVKYDNVGNVVWKKNFGGSDYDEYFSVTAISDGIVAVGLSNSFGNGDWTGVTEKGGIDAIIVKYDNAGNVVWKKNFGGSDYDRYYSVIAVSDGIVAVGWSNPESFGNGDWAGVTGKGNLDAIMVKYGNGVGIAETDNYPSLRVYPNPTTGALWVVTDHVRNDGRDGARPVSTTPTPTTTITNIEIFDMMGRTVHVETRHATSLQSQIENRPSPIEMNISHLPTGIYFLRIMTDEGVVVRKVVKE